MNLVSLSFVVKVIAEIEYNYLNLGIDWSK